MVAYNDLPEVNALSRERQQIAQAIYNLDHKGFIGSMVCVGETPDVPSAIVQTGFMKDLVPPQMIQTIKSAYQTRLQQIIDRLEELEVSDIPEGLPAPPEPPPPIEPAATDRRRR